MSLFNRELITKELIPFLETVTPGVDKHHLIESLISRFSLVRDRSVYYCADFALRVSTSKTSTFSNTVLSLSNLLKYDSRPFIVLVVRPNSISALLANTTMLKKISHSSHLLRIDNIKGSFNGTDIMLELDGIDNKPENFERLFGIHQAFTKEENIERLVEATNGISPHKTKPSFSESQLKIILQAPRRAERFEQSPYRMQLANDLENRTSRVADAITIAALIENVNLRGRVIEELITSDDPNIIEAIRKDLRAGRMLALKTDQKLGDYSRHFQDFNTETDIKTKVLFLQSSPKAFNIDKLLEFLATKDSVYMFFLLGIAENGLIITRLVSVFDNELLNALRIQFHWAGRNSRGVTQFDGSKLDKLLYKQQDNILIRNSIDYLQKLISL